MNTTNPLFTLYYQDEAVFNRVPFRDKVLQNLQIHKSTFFRWVNGESEPSDLEKKAIVKAYNKTRPPHFPAVTVEEIFPTTK